MECKDIEKKSIAIISDIHGNYQALKSVIEDIRSKNIEIIICLGDIIGKGINSRKCIELIRQNCQVVLKGNVDDRFCMNPDEFKDDENEYNRITYYQKTLNKEDIDYLVNLPLSEEF